MDFGQLVVNIYIHSGMQKFIFSHIINEEFYFEKRRKKIC